MAEPEEAPPAEEAPAAEGEAAPAAEGEEAPAAEEAPAEEAPAEEAPAEGNAEEAPQEGAPPGEGGEDAGAAEAAEGEPQGGEGGEEGAPAEPVPDGEGGAGEEEGAEAADEDRGEMDASPEPGDEDEDGEGGDEGHGAGEEGEEYDEFDEEGDYEDEYEDEDDKVDPKRELEDKYEELYELKARYMQDNEALQRRVIHFKDKKKEYDGEKPSDGKVTYYKYLNVLNNVHQVRLRLRQQQVKAARLSEELKNNLEEKRAKAIECRDSFRDFKRQVARYAEYSRTGKKIPLKIIQEVEDFELDKDAEVEEVRGSNISLKNRLAKLEQQLRKKDELAENLHVIDFEQLKIENQTLNEKIEERNEELHKLKKKTKTFIQVITHMREKLQFIQQENQVLRTDREQLDQELSAQRDLVAKTKHERDDYRSENAKLRQQTGIINSELLTKDYEERTLHIKKLQEEVATLKNKHGKLMRFIKAHNANQTRA